MIIYDGELLDAEGGVAMADGGWRWRSRRFGRVVGEHEHDGSTGWTEELAIAVAYFIANNASYG